MDEAWRTKRESVRATAVALREVYAGSPVSASATAAPTPATLDGAFRGTATTFDTRNGGFDLNEQGLLQTSAGQPVLGDGGPINVPQGYKISIAADGTVSGSPEGNGKTGVSLGRLKLVHPPEADLTRGADGLFRLRDGASADADPRVRVTAGAIEGSNVNAVEAMVGMISLARQFDTQMKLLQTAESNARKAAQLLAVNG